VYISIVIVCPSIVIVCRSINTDDSVSVRHGPKDLIKRQLYRVNLFHTTCRVEINGHKRQLFLEELDIVLASILAKGTNFAQMNSYIRDKCQYYLSSLETSHNPVDPCAVDSVVRLTHGNTAALLPCDVETVDRDVETVDRHVTHPPPPTSP
jgi:hypothetical protein